MGSWDSEQPIIIKFSLRLSHLPNPRAASECTWCSFHRTFLSHSMKGHGVSSHQINFKSTSFTIQQKAACLSKDLWHRVCRELRVFFRKDKMDIPYADIRFHPPPSPPPPVRSRWLPIG
ncbi:hypothetical protein AMEX_G25842 [Astyanax mexicanus]|uniref:Uncharacterized protein n=1 Tax=Astyanax mexicanus TaxID=7994 RepID=A0A8T2KSR2_ASTMX|nr:hypothetical protein AMEX_G25842 [Astyanax mexicanus]